MGRTAVASQMMYSYNIRLKKFEVPFAVFEVSQKP